ncbi:hypothetical protein DFH07DRAFT_1002606 [Mycena maculata]|uniref:Uncharacterized protein n=1 Tax=Mycena maculata TaxID=230809 RepID=A0AAD7HR40_9AGAR|nr:hypothetical protein DFH07DRAFT_1002606 [Mycena maculata]
MYPGAELSCTWHSGRGTSGVALAHGREPWVVSILLAPRGINQNQKSGGINSRDVVRCAHAEGPPRNKPGGINSRDVVRRAHAEGPPGNKPHQKKGGCRDAVLEMKTTGRHSSKGPSGVFVVRGPTDTNQKIKPRNQKRLGTLGEPPVMKTTGRHSRKGPSGVFALLCAGLAGVDSILETLCGPTGEQTQIKTVTLGHLGENVRVENENEELEMTKDGGDEEGGDEEENETAGWHLRGASRPNSGSAVSSTRIAAAADDAQGDALLRLNKKTGHLNAPPFALPSGVVCSGAVARPTEQEEDKHLGRWQRLAPGEFISSVPLLYLAVEETFRAKDIRRALRELKRSRARERFATRILGGNDQDWRRTVDVTLWGNRGVGVRVQAQAPTALAHENEKITEKHSNSNDQVGRTSRRRGAGRLDLARVGL